MFGPQRVNKFEQVLLEPPHGPLDLSSPGRQWQVEWRPVCGVADGGDGSPAGRTAAVGGMIVPVCR